MHLSDVPASETSPLPACSSLPLSTTNLGGGFITVHCNLCRKTVDEADQVSHWKQDSTVVFCPVSSGASGRRAIEPWTTGYVRHPHSVTVGFHGVLASGGFSPLTESFYLTGKKLHRDHERFYTGFCRRCVDRLEDTPRSLIPNSGSHSLSREDPLELTGLWAQGLVLGSGSGVL